jgi:methyl-accepting chemotaxis protein
MKLTIHRSITTKLLLMNALILAVFGGIILVVYTSFIHIEDSFTTIVDRDVSQVIENARMGRELTRVFADTKHVVDEDIGNEEILKKDGEKLIQKVNTLVTQSSDIRLQEALRMFSQTFRFLLEQAADTNRFLNTAQTLDQEFVTSLEKLKETVSEKLSAIMMKGEDASSLEHLKVLIPGYRETTLQIAVEFAKMKQAHTSSGKPEEQYPALFSLLNDLSMRFHTLTIADPGITESIQQLITVAEKYKATATLVHQSLTQYKAQLNEIKGAQDQVLTIMKEIDEGIEQTAIGIRKHIVAIISKSLRGILLLSVIFIGILTLAWFITRQMTKPLAYLSWCADQLADGDIECHVLDIKSHDEIGTLSRAFRKLMRYFQEMAQTVTEISRGNLEMDIGVRSKKDVLGNGFQQMIVYLKEMGEFAAHVARGDLRSQITLRSQADQLGNTFVRMKEGLIALIAEIRSGADCIASISTQVLKTSTKNSEALEKIGNAAEVTSSAMREMNSSAEEVRMNIEHLTSSVEETTASIGQMVSSIKHVAENSRKLSGFADNTRITMANIVQSLEKVANQAEHSKTVAKTTVQDAVSGQASVEQMINRMTGISEITKNISHIVSQLEDRSKEIGTILDVINEVADQTSLLALNASIIAAQAGVHGRGFAVVADEIKELATRVGTSTQEIARIIKSVQHDSSNAVNALEQGQREVENGVADAYKAGEALEKIGQSAENSSEVAAESAVLVREQTTASTQVAESLRDVTDMINEIMRATQEQEKNSSQLFEVVGNMQMLAAQVMRATHEQQQNTLHVTDFMEDVISLVKDNTATVSQLAQSANELASQADVLKNQVERFILPEHNSVATV